MAASNSKSTGLGNGYTLTASFSQGERNTQYNYSPVTVTATLSSGGTRWESSYNSYLRVYWHDNRENYDRLVAEIAMSSCAYNTNYYASGTINVYHKDDGSLSGYAYATFEKGGTSWAAPNTGGVATDWTALWSIARASQPSISPSNTFNIGDSITINTNRASSAFTHTISLSFGNYNYQIGTGITNSVSLNTSLIANNLYQQITSSVQGTGTITCSTYNGSTLIGTKTVSFTAKVSNSNPTFDAYYRDLNPSTTAITDDDSYIIRNKSNIQIWLENVDAKNYATPDSLIAIIEGVIYEGSLRGTGGEIDLEPLNLISDTEAQIVLTDSRGISTTKNLTIKVLDWQLPSAIINLKRHNNFYSPTDIKVDANYSPLFVDDVSKNTISIKVRYKKTTDSTYGEYTTLQDNVVSTLTLDNNYAWDIQVLLEDELGSTTYNLSIARGIPIVFFDRKRESVGINCFPQNDTSFEVNGKSLLDLTHPIGSVYLSVDSTNPGTLFGGTWRQITDDAYLKIVANNAGDLGGTSSNHKIPVGSLPAHNHTASASAVGDHSHKMYSGYVTYQGGSATANSPATANPDWGGDQWTGGAGGHSHTITVGNTGDGNAYYPYYYGIYAWVRTS